MRTFTLRSFLAAIGLCMTAMTLGLTSASFATPVSENTIFELDANTKDGLTSPPSLPTALPDDWENFPVMIPTGTPPALPNPLGTSHADTATGIIVDSTPHVFTGGSKDTQDVSKWDFRLGSSPQKGDLLHAYAAAYSSGTDLITFFGTNRKSFNGTTAVGFWFFHNQIGLDNATGKFTGVHADGDVLIAVDYDQGGKIGTIVVYKWDTTQQPGEELQEVTRSSNTSGISGLFCNAAFNGTPANSVCALSNNAGISIPWAPGEGATAQFFEGGINITDVVGGDACFASFMATSRSSTTKNSEIKNFVLSSFPVCKLSAKKFCDFKELKGANQARFTVSGNVKNDGLGTLYNIAVTDSPAFESAPSFFKCTTTDPATAKPDLTQSANPATLLKKELICYQGTIVLPEFQTTGKDEVTATGNTLADNTGTTVTSDLATAECKAPEFKGGLDVSKACTACLEDSDTTGRVVLDLSYAGSVCNPNTFPVTKVTVTDEVTGGNATSGTSGIVVKRGLTTLTNGDFTLDAATKDTAGNFTFKDCVTYTGAYFPNKAYKQTGLSDDPPTLTATEHPDKAFFGDTVSASGKLPFKTIAETLGAKLDTCQLCREDSLTACTKN